MLLQDDQHGLLQEQVQERGTVLEVTVSFELGQNTVDHVEVEVFELAIKHCSDDLLGQGQQVELSRLGQDGVQTLGQERQVGGVQGGQHVVLVQLHVELHHLHLDLGMLFPGNLLEQHQTQVSHDAFP